MNNTTTKDPNYERAGEILCEIYYYRTRTSELIRELLELFQRFDHLTYQYYDGRTALHVLLDCGAAAKQDIQTFCNICPRLEQVAMTRDKDGYLPIHLACCKSSEEVVELVAAIAPQTLAERQDDGDDWHSYPLNFALLNSNHNLSFDGTLKLLLDSSHPNALLNDECFDQVIQKGCPLKFLQDMVDMFPGNQLYIHREVTIEQIKVLSRLFSQLCTLHFTEFVPRRDAFETLLREIPKQSNCSIREIGLGLPSLQEEAGGHGEVATPAMALQGMMQSMMPARLEMFLPPEEDHSALRLWLEAIQVGLERNPSINSVQCSKVETHRCGDRYREVSFVAKRHTVDPLLEGIVEAPPVFGDECVQRAKNLKPNTVQPKKHAFLTQSFEYRSSNLQALFSANTLPGEAVSFSGLTSFSLDVTYYCHPKPTPTQLTESVLQLLRGGHSFETLQVIGQTVDPYPILEELQTNSHLKSIFIQIDRSQTEKKEQPLEKECLKLVEEHNATLMECDISGLGEGHAKLDYFLDLNRCGRAMARTADCDQLIQLVLQAWKPVIPLRMSLWDPTDVERDVTQIIVYGLLREAPSTWCNGGKQ